jgi:hypothetical protein
VQVNFRIVLLLALGAIVDLHVKLRRTNVEVKGHEETLLDVVFIHKLRLATLEVLLASAVIPNFSGSH